MDTKLTTYQKWQPFLLGLAAAIGLWAGLNMRQTDRSTAPALDETTVGLDQSQKIKDVISFVQSKYIDSIDQDMATDLMLESFLSILDPYSEYIPAQYMHKYAGQLHGKTRGIGISLINIDNRCMVTDVKKDSPASIAGIKTGDIILAVDKKNISGFETDADSIINVIETFPKDSVHIQWEGTDKKQAEQLIALTELEEVPVPLSYNPVKEILYVKLNQISKESYRQFMKVLEQHFENRESKHLIIDLRDNSGGLVHEAAFILNQLIPENDVLMFKTSGLKIKEKEYKSTGKPFFIIEKVAVLVNGRTASSAELIAAALQDLDRAVIIGNPTLGKATVMEQYSLGDGSAIRLAVSRFYPASGRSIQKNYEEEYTGSYLGSFGANTDSIYYSLKKNKLPANQGVIPDVIIPFNESEQALRMNGSEVANRFVARNYFELKSLIGKEDDIKTNPRIKEMITSDISASKIQLGTNDLNPIINEYHFAIANWFFGEPWELRMRLTNDEYLQKAIQQLQK